MRPSLLNPLFAPITVLPGIGERVEKLYRRLLRRNDVPRVIELLFHLPTGVIDRRAQPKLREVKSGSVVTLAVTVERHRAPPRHNRRAPFLVYTTDGTGDLVIAYFAAHPGQVEKLLPVGSRRYVSGTVEFYDGVPQMVHPDWVAEDAKLASMPMVEPVYPLTEGLSPLILRRSIGGALATLPVLPEWLDETHLSRARWPTFADALAALHRPGEPDSVAPGTNAWQRLAYDELLANQLALALMRAHMRRSTGRRRVQAEPVAVAVAAGNHPPLKGEGRTAAAGSPSRLRDGVPGGPGWGDGGGGYAPPNVLHGHHPLPARKTGSPQNRSAILRGAPSAPTSAFQGEVVPATCDGPASASLASDTSAPHGPASNGFTSRLDLLQRLSAAVPFRLTASQHRAIDEIFRDLKRPERMLRLLQGDVGSGKTVVALFACAAAIAAGGQAAMMAPTEILARQHHKTIAPLAEAAGMRAAILTGRERGGERADILERLAAGDIDLVVGTHALFSEDVVFHDLALAAIDEQHRFGVNQRLALASKGNAVDLLVMTATPIPRSLVLSWFGDMDHSELRDKPPGRLPIDTRALPLARLDEVTLAIGRSIAQGRRAYWVCPLVAESETIDLAAAQERFATLSETFGAAVDLVHGRMKPADKDAAMARFAAGETQLLVATTAIEVGVDVPEATIMVIEHAERFGLAQLHQLRGRIGRGAERSTCLMLYKAPLGGTAKERLAVMRDTEDGFRIAEEDLRLRGEGDLLGTRQSGLPGFRIAQIGVHGPLAAMARDDAALALQRNPGLTGARGEALRLLLYLFERDEAVRLIAAG